MIFRYTISPLCKCRKLHAILFVTFFLVMPFLVQSSHAQSGVGVGYVFPYHYAGGGISIRYKPVQVFVAGMGNFGDGFYIDLGARYNHPVKNWRRIKLNAYGHVTRLAQITDDSHPPWYQFSGGISADLWLGRKPKGLVLSADTGVAINNSDGFARSPTLALALGFHYFFW